MGRPPAVIAMLEDDEDDRHLTKSIFKELEVDYSLHFFVDPVDFFSFLSRENKPTLLIIDYNARPVTGIDIIKKLKSHPGTNHMPVVVLSEAMRDSQVRDCYRAGANSVIFKPDNIDQTRFNIEIFLKYWMNAAQI